MDNLSPISDPEDVPTKEYVDDADALKVDTAGDTMSGALILHDHPTQDFQAATKQYADNAAGGAADHQLLVNLDKDDHSQYAPIHVIDAADPDPTENQRPGQIVVRKGVAVNEGLEFLQKQGGTMTGPLLLQSDPASDMEAATKQYVDSGVMVAAYADGASIPSSATTTTNWDGWTIQIESGGWAVDGTGNQLVVPVSGWYQCHARSAFGSSSGGTVRAVLISPNSQVSVGSGAIGNTMTSPSSNTSGLGFMVAVSGIIHLSAGDTLSMRGRQDTGSTQASIGYLQAVLMRPT